MPTPPSADDTIAADTILSLSLHPTTNSVNDDRHQQRLPLPWPPSTAASINNDCNCCHQQQTMTAGFWWSLSLNVWQRQWRLLMVAIEFVVDRGGSGIEPTAPMATSLTVAAVDSGSNNGVFTTASHVNDCYPCPHCPHPRPLWDEDWTTRWRVNCDASHLSLPRSLLLVPFLSPLMG